jgi:hypothetical protein
VSLKGAHKPRPQAGTSGDGAALIGEEQIGRKTPSLDTSCAGDETRWMPNRKQRGEVLYGSRCRRSAFCMYAPARPLWGYRWGNRSRAAAVVNMASRERGQGAKGLRSTEDELMEWFGEAATS